MSKKYSYEIHVQDLIPPIGGVYRYFAIVRHIYEDKGDHEEKVQHSFGETHGATKEEAEKKMRDKVERWIEDQK
jgi:hypothetical protein